MAGAAVLLRRLAGRAPRAAAAAAVASGRGAARRAPLSTAAVPFYYQELFDMAKDTTTPYKKLTSDHVSTLNVCSSSSSFSSSREGAGVRRGCVRVVPSMLTHLPVCVHPPTLQ